MSDGDASEMASVMRNLQRRHGRTGRSKSKSKSNKRLKQDDGEGCHETDPPAHAALHSESQSQPGVGANAAHCDDEALQPDSVRTGKEDAGDGCHKTGPTAHAALHPVSQSQPAGASAAHCDALQLQLDSETTVKEDACKGSREGGDPPTHDVLPLVSCSPGATYCNPLQIGSSTVKEDAYNGSHERDPPAQAVLHSESCSVGATYCNPLELDESPPESSIVASRNQTPLLKRPRMDNDDRTQRLPLGTFASGRSIYRNSLHPGETLQDGHVTISNLVLPGTTSAFCTTFAGPDMAWLETFLDDVNDLIVVQHDVRQQVQGGGGMDVEDMNSSPRVIGDAEVIGMDQNERPGWYFLLTTPHTGGCLHAKLLLFRSDLGLRAVVCGSNLYQDQWESDRDCLWVQDFFCITHTGDDDEGDDSSTSTTNNSFEPCLRTFLDDLTKCRTEPDQKLVAIRLKAVFNGVNFQTASARLVFSFPRPRTSKESRGGWRLLANSVHMLLRKHTEDAEDDGIAKHRDVPGLVHAMAGSMGNIKPDFILQMHQAMHGIDDPVPKKRKTGTRIPSVDTSSNQDTDEITVTDWDQVEDIGLRCLWPSRQTALSMNFQAIINIQRAIPYSFWKTIKDKAKRNIFFDAPPNPTVMGLPHLACHPISHSKVLIKTGGGGIGVVYVGSHNFSKSAWGLRGAMPKNVELGVVLASQSTSLTQEWCSRLPCLLPKANAQSPSTYVPASAHTGIRNAYQEGRWIEAFQMLADCLKSSEDEQEPDAGALELKQAERMKND
jgi:hypothetical protein